MVFFSLQLTLLPLKLMDVPEKVETEVKSPYREVLKNKETKKHCYHSAVFSFLYFLKIKISKIYVRFEIFQKYPPVAPHRATGPKCNFFLQIRNEVPSKKKGPVTPTGDRGLSPTPGATGACRPLGGRQGPFIT